MSKFQKPQTAEEREAFKAQRREEDRERLTDAIESLRSSEGWQRFITSRARFHKYSFNNCLLIASQCPEATYVASYKAWQGLGRQVRKGEHGIRILAPVTVKVRGESRRVGISDASTVAQSVAAARRELGDSEEFSILLRFKSVAVFDISQTEGDELPEYPGEPIEGDSHECYIAPLVEFGESIGYAVSFEEIGGMAKGYCDPQNKRILVDSRMSPNAQVRTLVHELAHALGVGYSEFGRETAEVIVESAAWIVCGALGLDTSGESIPYIAGWDGGDLEALKSYAAKVDECANRLELAAGIREARS